MFVSVCVCERERESVYMDTWIDIESMCKEKEIKMVRRKQDSCVHT